MVFWRKKKNATEQEVQDAEDKILHPDGEPEIEPPVEYDADISEDLKHEIEPTENEIIDDLGDGIPVPDKRTADVMLSDAEVEKDDAD